MISRFDGIHLDPDARSDSYSGSNAATNRETYRHFTYSLMHTNLTCIFLYSGRFYLIVALTETRAGKTSSKMSSKLRWSGVPLVRTHGHSQCVIVCLVVLLLLNAAQISVASRSIVYADGCLFTSTSDQGREIKRCVANDNQNCTIIYKAPKSDRKIQGLCSMAVLGPGEIIAACPEALLVRRHCSW
jgi:hypothetical protein